MKPNIFFRKKHQILGLILLIANLSAMIFGVGYLLAMSLQRDTRSLELLMSNFLIKIMVAPSYSHLKIAFLYPFLDRQIYEYNVMANFQMISGLSLLGLISLSSIALICGRSWGRQLIVFLSWIYLLFALIDFIDARLHPYRNYPFDMPEPVLRFVTHYLVILGLTVLLMKLDLK